MMLDYNSLNYYQRLNYIFQCFQAVISVPGIIGNILIICIFLRKRLINYSYSFYSIVMACADIFPLLSGIRHWSALVVDANLDLVSPFFCAIGEYLPYVGGTISLWLLALISLDRFLTIVYPNRFKLLKKRHFQAIMALILIAYSLLAHIQLPLYYTLEPTSNETNSTLVCSIPQNVSATHSIIFMANTFAVVIVINNFLSGKMVWYLISTRKKIAVSLKHKHHSYSTVKDHKFALSSIGLNICCIICKLPLSLGLLVTYNMTLDPDLMQLLFTIFVLIYTIDNGAAFFINITVNSIFYEEFLIMIRVTKDTHRKSTGVVNISQPK